MSVEPGQRGRPRSRPISRREILKLAATAGLLASCRSLEKTATPTIAPSDTPAPTQTSTATAMPIPSPTMTSTRAPTMKPQDQPTATYAPLPTEPPTNTPENTPTSLPIATPTLAPISALGRVVHARHPGLWAGEALAPEAMRQTLDSAIATLTGLDEADAAWAHFFGPQERIAIKVNAISGSSFHTHVALAMAVANRLQQTGVPGEQIIIFDRHTAELEGAGYPINRDGPGVRCYGTDQNYTAGWKIMDTDVGLTQILLECDALINIPIIKQHSIAGISFAMKNHYGTFDRPGSFHGGRIARGMAELNALPPIKDRTRLIIGDALAITTRGWHTGVRGDSILMSFDPVAHDTVGLQIYTQVITSEGLNPERATHLATGWLTNGADIGLGVNDLNSIDLIEVNLG